MKWVELLDAARISTLISKLVLQVIPSSRKGMELLVEDPMESDISDPLAQLF